MTEVTDNGSSRDQNTQDFVRGLKEREELKAQLADKEKEVNNLKGQNYDLLKKLESLQNQIAELSTKGNSDGKKSRPQTAGRKPKRPAKRKPVKPDGKDRKKSSVETPGNKDIVDPFEDPEKLYMEIAEKFPDLPLSTVLSAEKRFVEADINRDGTIDDTELEKLLDKCSASQGTALFTRDQVQDIMKKIDVDNTLSIDFMECLSILDLLRQNRKTGLPTAIQNQKSAVCSIQ